MEYGCGRVSTISLNVRVAIIFRGDDGGDGGDGDDWRKCGDAETRHLRGVFRYLNK